MTEDSIKGWCQTWILHCDELFSTLCTVTVPDFCSPRNSFSQFVVSQIVEILNTHV